MSFTSPLILYLDRTSLVAVSNKQVFPKLVFPTEVINALEVKNETQLFELLAVWVNENQLAGQQALLLLDTELVFKRAIAAKLAKEELFAEQQHFREVLPFVPLDLVVTQLSQAEASLLVAINGELCRQIVDGLEKSGLKIKEIVPAELVGVTSSSLLGPAETDTVRKMVSKVPQEAKFKHHLPQPEPTQTSTNETQLPNKKEVGKTSIFGLAIPVWVAWVLAGVFLLALVGFVGVMGVRYWAKYQNQNSEQNPPSAQQDLPLGEKERGTQQLPAASESAAVTEVATSAATPIEKSLITISVLNGSGIAGQAGVVREALVKAGYTTITVGNALQQSGESTTVSFVNDVGVTNRDEIIAAITPLFSSVATEEASSSSAMVTITTGSN